MLALVVAASLLGAFGQRPVTSRATSAAAELTVSAPLRLRGGLLYEGRFEIDAAERVRHATLVLDRGWLDGMTINTMAPSPLAESGLDGTLALDFGPLDAGQTLVVRLQFQVNPTTVGRRSQAVTLTDGARTLATTDRTVTVLP